MEKEGGGGGDLKEREMSVQGLHLEHSMCIYMYVLVEVVECPSQCVILGWCT